MAQEMDDGNYWLPAEFLNFGKPNCARNRSSSGLYGMNSDLSSPVESVTGSTETSSDEEDYLNELSRKLAQSTLDDNLWKTEPNFKSTLCGCKQISSPNCPSPPLSCKESAWDLLYAAAGEVERLRMADEAGSKYFDLNRNNHIAPRPPPRIPSPNLQFRHLQAAKIQQLKQQQYHEFLQQTRVARNGGGNINSMALPSSTLQQSQALIGSGMRAVFLDTKRECSGTGVFLPRQIGAPTEPRKKRGCSTALLPDRVVQALNLNLESQTQNTGGRYGKSVSMEKDLRLPQEWTY